MSNKFLDREYNSIQSTTENLHDLLLETMQQEFPNDEKYKNGKTYVSQDNEESPDLPLVSIDDLKLSIRNQNNVININASNPTYTKYRLDKMLPSIDDDDLDDILDDEWEFFIDPNTIGPPRVDGLFIINKEISLNPPDFHNEYIKRGPAVIDERINSGELADTVIKTTFCVFFIQNSTALPIPNYKTLEVMLVERNKTYTDIQEATVEQTKEFDLEIDGKFTADLDGDIDPVEEFRFRQMLDRSISWNQKVRFDSGYIPGNDENAVQFERDPGDYLLPPAQRVNGFYNSIVYQKQTYREKLRERFEGKIIALQWPIPYNSAQVQSGTLTGTANDIQSDDKVFLLRMMINGYWKQVIATNVLRQYALVNNFDLSGVNFILRTDSGGTLGGTNDFDEVQGGTLQSGYLVGGLYGQGGLINVLVDNGGITILQDEDITDSDIQSLTGTVNNFINALTAAGRTDAAAQVQDIVDAMVDNVKSPAWSDFSHIAEVDRLEPSEYETFLNDFNNGGNPFDIDYLQPYEPPGSIAYYPAEQLSALQSQANAQSAVDSIKRDIMELLPQINSRAAELDQRFNAQPANYEQYALQNLGPSSDIYKVMFSNDRFKYYKRKSNGVFKEKLSDKQFLKLVEMADRIFRKMSKKQEDHILYKPGTRDFTLLVEAGDSLLDTLDNYVTANKQLFTENTIQGIGQRTVGQALAGIGAGATAVAGGGVGALVLGVGASYIGAPIAIAAVGAGLIAAGIAGALDVDITPKNQDDRKGMPRSFVGDRQGRLLKRESYIKLIIGAYIYDAFVKPSVINDPDPSVNRDLFDVGVSIDQNFGSYRSLIDNALTRLKQIDDEVISSTTVAQFSAIYTDLQNIETDFDGIDTTLFEQGEQYKITIDNAVKYMIEQQYSSIQFVRKKLKDFNKGKYFIIWPEDAKTVVSSYFPGKVFDNYQPTDYTGN